MEAHVGPEQITLQTLVRSSSLRHPIRDLSIADFNWVAQKSIYPNLVLVSRYHSGAEEQPADARCATRNMEPKTCDAIETHQRGGCAF